jgi:hypothetical protein
MLKAYVSPRIGFAQKLAVDPHSRRKICSQPRLTPCSCMLCAGRRQPWVSCQLLQRPHRT